MDYRYLSDLFGRKFSIAILDTLQDEGNMRNKELKEELDPASDSLSDTLDILEEEGLIERNEANRVNVSYNLTDKGRHVIEKIRDISKQIS